jgi:HSP20 family protein
MTLVRWEPTRELGTLQHEINRVFGNIFDLPVNAAVRARRQWIPAMDLVETPEEYVLHADLPGIAADDVTIEFDENVLTVSGERRAQEERTGDGYRRIERASGSFTRTLTLPRGIDPERITASFADGVLDVHIPRPERRKRHRVAIATGGDGAPATIEDSDAAATEVPLAA